MVKLADTLAPMSDFPVAKAEHITVKIKDKEQNLETTLNSMSGGYTVEELPEASAELFGKVYQYIGETTDTLTKGYFYVCTTNENAEYIWEQTEVQKPGLPTPESKDKLLLSTENEETSELEWKQVDKSTVGNIPFVGTHDEWDSLSLEEKAKYKMVNFTDDYTGGGGSADYSTDEQVIGKWIDGKPIYRKCFEYNGSLKDSVAVVGIITNVKDLVEFKLCGNLTDNYLFAGSMSRDNNTSNTNSTFAFLQKTDGRIYIGHYGENAITNGKWTVIVEYTKTN